MYKKFEVCNSELFSSFETFLWSGCFDQGRKNAGMKSNELRKPRTPFKIPLRHR